MKKIIFATLLASVMSIAYAKPYPKHDLSQIVTPRSVNFAVAEQTYLDLKQHAAMYPTTFDNAQDKALATQEAQELARIFNGLFHLEIITPEHPAYQELLHRAARVNWIAHNLDVPNTAAAADKHYQTLLTKLSGKNKALLLGEYGSFLASVGHTQRAVNALQESVQQGNIAAKRELAMALLTQNKKADALKNIREYLHAYPNDTTAQELLEAIQAGRVEVKTIQ